MARLHFLHGGFGDEVRDIIGVDFGYLVAL